MIVTADVDAFIATEHMLKPILTQPDKSVWLYRYELSLNTGYTFMMPFIGAKAKVWSDLLHYDDHRGDLNKFVDIYKAKMPFDDGYIVPSPVGSFRPNDRASAGRR